MTDAVVESISSYEQERGKPMPSRIHGIVQANLISEFVKCKQVRTMSEVTLELAGRLFTPDLSVFSRQPVDFKHDDIHVTDPPLVTVEIFSPTQGYQEVMNKVQTYLDNGVKTCWIVNPPLRTITLYLADGSQKTHVEGVVSDPATGITADLETVFS